MNFGFDRNGAGRLLHLGRELPDGPWHAEPDRADLEHGGLPCLLLRGPRGTWCGYVGLPSDHPWIGIDLIAEEGLWSDCHVTYQRGRPPLREPLLAAPAECAQWIGFSCSEEGDLSLDVVLTDWACSRGGVYRDLAFAEREVRRLADLVLATSSN